MSKAKAQLDGWCKRVAPSTALSKWYGGRPDRFGEFRHRYGAEVNEAEAAAAVRHLAELADEGTLTLLTATMHPELSEAAVLADLLRR